MWNFCIGAERGRGEQKEYRRRQLAGGKCRGHDRHARRRQFGLRWKPGSEITGKEGNIERTDEIEVGVGTEDIQAYV